MNTNPTLLIGLALETVKKSGVERRCNPRIYQTARKNS